MPDYRRAYLKGGTFFFTVVSYNRRPVFKDKAAIDLLWQCFQATMAIYPFSIDAIVILPDHLHTIWTIADSDADFSTRWRRIKATFSHKYMSRSVEDISESMRQKKEKGIWQRRFWEHAIRDQADFNQHCDYIHYNPVKHGLVKSPSEWKHSSFMEFVERGLYPQDWGQSEAIVEDLLRMDME